MNGRTNSSGTDGTIAIALKAPTDFSVAANTLDSLALTWTDPEDEYSQPSNVLVGEFKYTRIVRKLGSAPSMRMMVKLLLKVRYGININQRRLLMQT